MNIQCRRSLWEIGLDYGHGTGHGVGAALNVHEGPQSISRRFQNTQPLLPGMIVSNEPGYYKSNEFGIRIENLLAVVPTDMPTASAAATQDKPPSYFLRFLRLTLVPIQRELIDVDMLTAEEIDWVDTYHSEVSSQQRKTFCRWPCGLCSLLLGLSCTDPSGAASEAVGESTRLAAQGDRAAGLRCRRAELVHRTAAVGAPLFSSDALACSAALSANSSLDARGSGHGYACNSAESCLLQRASWASNSLSPIKHFGKVRSAHLLTDMVPLSLRSLGPLPQKATSTKTR